MRLDVCTVQRLARVHLNLKAVRLNLFRSEALLLLKTNASLKPNLTAFITCITHPENKGLTDSAL